MMIIGRRRIEGGARGGKRVGGVRREDVAICLNEVGLPALD